MSRRAIFVVAMLCFGVCSGLTFLNSYKDVELMAYDHKETLSSVCSCKTHCLVNVSCTAVTVIDLQNEATCKYSSNKEADLHTTSKVGSVTHCKTNCTTNTSNTSGNSGGSSGSN